MKREVSSPAIRNLFDLERKEMEDGLIELAKKGKIYVQKGFHGDTTYLRFVSAKKMDDLLGFLDSNEDSTRKWLRNPSFILEEE